jgi:8-oxo-dGTP pyrophosphatase MutT (NUDIX family)
MHEQLAILEVMSFFSHHRSKSVAKVLLINNKQEALILTVGSYRARPDKAFTPDLPGGMVDPGETELDAVQRELIEETGIELNKSAFTLVYTKIMKVSSASVTRNLFIAHVDHTPEVTISWEHAAYKWVSLDGLLEKVALRPFYKEAVEYSMTHQLL